MHKADHSGHRARMKKKLREQGLDVFEPHEVLEILLYYAIPQRNTNDIAKNLIDRFEREVERVLQEDLIDRFGSLSSVLDASVDSLMQAGLTEHQALYLKLIPGVTRRYLLDKYDNPEKVMDFHHLGEYIADKFVGFEECENVLLVLTDKKGRVVYSGMIAQGDFDAAAISVRSIVTLAVNYSATAAILAHNHPSGIALPSKEDVIVTRYIKDALKMIGVSLLDHFIVSDHDCVSMAESDFI